MRHGKLSAAALGLLAVAFSVAGVSAATLTGLTVATDGELTRIHVRLDEPAEVSHFMVVDPPRLFVDCRGVDVVTPKDFPAGKGSVGAIEASVWHGNGHDALTRLAIDLMSPSRPLVEMTGDGFLVTLAPAGPSPVPAPVGHGSPEVTTSSMVGQVQPEALKPTDLNPANVDNFDYELPSTPEYTDRYSRTEPTVAAFEDKVKVGLAGRGGPRVNIDMQGADIYTVLRALSEYSGVNIVMGYDVRDEVTDPLSFHLSDVPWGEALELILRSASLWYREENGVIRVDTEENLREEELTRGSAARQLEQVAQLTTRIVEVVYATAAELAPSIERTLTQRGHVEVDARTNSLVVTDIPSRMEAAVEMIQHLDSQTPQVEIVAKLVDVDARYSKDLGVLWNVGGLHSGEGGFSVEGGLGANSVLDPTADVRFGLVRSWGTVSSLLSAMERENKADIISNPRITTVNNREAKILVGKKIPLIVLDEAGNPVTQLTTIGITLLVTPHINDNNRITLDLHPEVSDLSSQATVQGGVIINTSEADTRVMVENGQTAVIGGLIRSNTSMLTRGVPILKDIPVIGNLFKQTSEVQEKRELLIFVTPRIINSFATAN